MYKCPFYSRSLTFHTRNNLACSRSCATDTKQRKKEQNREYYLHNKQDIQHARKQHYTKNRTRIRETQKGYSAKNKYKLAFKQKELYNKKWGDPKKARAFLQSREPLLGITSPNDWYRVSVKQVLIKR
jgi:hypothetical protein